MSANLGRLTSQVLAGRQIGRDEALALAEAPLHTLCASADTIRSHFCGSTFDLCTIINGKSGRCPEDCKFCAQSAHYHTDVPVYPLLDAPAMVRQAKRDSDGGVLRFSIVTSGKSLSNAEVEQVCDNIRAIRAETSIAVCGSFGLLNEAQYKKIKAAGATRIHCNLESSRDFFATVCSTHSYDEKIAALQAARRAGMSICSGGIMGLGETMADRIDLALTLRKLGVRSVPVNFLSPIPGTPYAGNTPLPDDEKRRIIALFRFILPDASIRLAGGRGGIADKGEGCFCSGANAAISGDMLTTAGITIATDLTMLRRLDYKPGLWNA